MPAVPVARSANRVDGRINRSGLSAGPTIAFTLQRFAPTIAPKLDSMLFHRSRTLAAEEGPNNIRANTVAMGLMMGASLERLFLAALTAEQREAALAQMTARIALGHIPPDEDCAKPVMFLLSDLASEVTGALLDVNGGEWVAP